MRLQSPTAWQTAGPFFTFALIREEDRFVVSPDHPSAITVSGTMFDGAGNVTPDGIVEIWQADEQGRYLDQVGSAAFRGHARTGTDADGRFQLVTVKPGRVPAVDGAPQAPHIAVSVMARGMLKRAVTRFYFEDEEAANATDPLLAGVDPARRSTLIASLTAPLSYNIDIWLQGHQEMVFLDI